MFPDLMEMTLLVGSLRSTNFLDYHHTSEQDKLKIASFYMEGCALAWFK